jgi:hypothetical protein
MAMAFMCWGEFHHTMYQLLPISEWSDSELFKYMCDKAVELIPEDPSSVFDIRTVKKKQTKILHVRCNIYSSTHMTHIIWSPEISQKDIADASLRAALHPNKKCIIVNLFTSEKITVECHNSEAVFDAIDTV